MLAHEDLDLVTDVIRHVLSGETDLHVERVASGVSTAVYRVSSASRQLYVRVLPEPDASFAPEAHVHRLLRARALRVPDVVHVEVRNPRLERAVMFTTAIPGQAIAASPRATDLASIVREAGRELAIVNQVPVQGFGWIRRDRHDDAQLCAEYSTHTEWLAEHFVPSLSVLAEGRVLPPRDVQAVREAFAEAAALLANAPAVLAHGDFDTTHIFHQEGQYAGLIDFGEIRGTHPLYDVGHFAIEGRELLTPLLVGYAEVSPLPADHLLRIHLSAVLIATRRLGRRLTSEASVYEPDRQGILRSLRALARRG